MRYQHTTKGHKVHCVFMCVHVHVYKKPTQMYKCMYMCGQEAKIKHYYLYNLNKGSRYHHSFLYVPMSGKVADNNTHTMIKSALYKLNKQ